MGRRRDPSKWQVGIFLESGLTSLSISRIYVASKGNHRRATAGEGEGEAAVMPQTPPKPSKKSAASAPSSLGQQDKQQKVDSKIFVQFSVKQDWTKWCQITLNEPGRKGYTKGNPLAETITRELQAMKSRGDCCRHTQKLFPSDEIDPMYQYFPGFGNRQNLETLFCPPDVFANGVHQQLSEACPESIAGWSFEIDNKTPFQLPPQ